MFYKVSKNKSVLLMAIIAVLCFTALSLQVLKGLFANADSEVWNNYDVIYDAQENFKGVNIKNSTGGTLDFWLPSTASTVPAVSDTHGGAFSVITFEFDKAVSTGSTTGILIQLDRAHATAAMGPRLFLETADGVLYRFSSGSTRNDVFITENGTAKTLQSTNNRYTLTQEKGTLFVPWTALLTTGTKTTTEGDPAPASGVALSGDVSFIKFHFTVDIRTSGFFGETRPTGFGTIASVAISGESVAVEQLLNVPALTYSTNASDTTADVNLADITKGNKVYARHSISGTYVFDEHPLTIQGAIAAQAWSRTKASLTVKYENTSGGEIRPPEIIAIAYNSSAGSFAYEITAPNIAGYIFDDASAQLIGSLSGDAELTLTYFEVPAPKLTVRCVDSGGNAIRAEEFAFTNYDAVSGIASYSITQPEIFAYHFVSASLDLSGTITQDTVITLTYEQDGFDNFDVIYDAQENFKGVNIKNSTSGTLDFWLPSTASMVPAVSGTHGGAFSVITFEFDKAVSTGSTTGILIQLDRAHATAATGPRLFLETADGVLYRFSSGSTRNDVFITENGTAKTLTSTNSRYTLTQEKGTLFVPWTALLTTGTKTTVEGDPAPPDAVALTGDVTFVKFHFTVDIRTGGWFSETRPTGFGTIAAVAVNGESVAVEQLLNVPALTYSTNASDTTADVNLADITKGNKVYARHSISGTYVFDEHPLTIQGAIAAQAWSRTKAWLTVKYENTSGGEIRPPEVKAIAYNSSAGGFAYEITAPNIAGYIFDDASAQLSGSLDGDAELTLTYFEVPAPKLTVHYLDNNGNAIKQNELAFTDYNIETGSSSYEIIPPQIFAYAFVSSSLPLTGTISEDTVITLTYESDVFSNYSVITESDEFVGINIKNSTAGGLVVDVSGFDAGTGYGLVTVELPNVNPFESTGFLLQFARLNSNNAQVRMFLEATDGTIYRLFAGPENLLPSRDDVLIKPNGTIGSVATDSTNHRHMFGTGAEGTLYIPWELVYTPGSGNPIAEGTVFTKFHFGREMRYDTSINKPIVLGFLGAVKVDGGQIVVAQLVDFTKLIYTADQDDDTADVNLSDFTKGNTVYVRHWASGTHVFDSDLNTGGETFEKTLALWTWTRMPPKITINYVDEDGDTIKESTFADAQYSPGGSTYTITPAAIIGYSYLSADKELTGVSDADMEITLTYKLVNYVITIKYQDEDGNEIKESSTASGKFGDYLEITPEEIQGYSYKEASGGLKFTVTGEKTLVLVYAKDSKGGGGCGSCSSGILTSAGMPVMIISLALAAAITTVLRKKKSI